MKQMSQAQDRIARMLMRFIESHMHFKPRKALVDVHEHSIVATLDDIVPPVERDYAREHKHNDLLDQSYTRVFESVRHLLEIEIEQILDRRVNNSLLRVDADSGNGYVVFNLAEQKNDNG
jgi:uncharacterized protein YbcI